MRRSLKTVRAALPGLLVAGALVAGCGKPESAPPPAGPPEVGVVTIQPQRVAVTTELAGRVSAFLVAEVRPQVGGIVQERRFVEGSDVRAGDVLFQIDSATYEAALASARAALARAEANLPPLRLREERYRELVAINAVSRQDHDSAAGQLRQAEAEVEVARAALDLARINLEHCRVTAPISGRIGKSSVTTGALVTANQAAALATVQQLDPVYVDVTESSANLLRLRQGLASGRLKQGGAEQAAVRLVLENGTPYPHQGTLKFSDVTVQPGTGSVTLRTVFPNPEQLLLPGMFARAVVQEGVNESALLVPQRGVSRNQKGEPVAMVVGADEKVEARPLKIDRAVGEAWLLAEGLAAGDRVILEGLQRIRPGVPVRALPFGGAPQTAAGK